LKVPLQRYWELLVTYLRPQRRRVALLATLLLSSIGLQVINPQIIRFFIDTALSGGQLESLTLAALLFLGMALLTQVLTVTATYVGEDVGWRATNWLRADLALHCLKLDMTFHNEHTPGEMIERIDSDVADLAIFFSQFVIRVLGNLLLLAGVMVLLFREDWRVGLALSIYTVTALAAINRIRTIAVPHWTAAREASANLFGFLEERLSGTEDIRSSGASDYVMRGLYHFSRERLQKERKAGVMNILVIMLWVGFFTIGQIVAFALGFTLLSQGLITLGTVYLIVYYTDAIFRPLREITNEIQNLQKAGAGIERIEELFNIKSHIEDGPGANFPSGALSVRFEDVSFGYNDEEMVLKNISFELQPGKVLGLLGRTGSGKTTLTRLLFRLYDPSAGEIRVGDVEIAQVQLASLRQRIGLVTQEVQLFRATVRDNLSFFDRSIPDERMLAIIKELGLWDWYQGQPDGLDTKLEDGSSSLSAGEGQLLAFARVFLRNPGLVILDEASSRLDPVTERRIEHAVDKLLENRTAIIIAHHLTTVHRVDKIMILENGCIQEHGDYNELVNNPDSRFVQLLQTGLEEVLA
jgi:ATP-binding cassette subfamily B protein/ATP-binding cassette subfamily C protein